MIRFSLRRSGVMQHSQPSGTLSKLVKFSSAGGVEEACHQDGIHHLQLNSGGYEDIETCLADWLNSPFYGDTG